MIEVIIQRCEKRHYWDDDRECWVEGEPFWVYFVAPSPAPGITARGGSRIINPDDDPLWNEIRRIADTRDRVAMETVEPMQHLEPTIVKSIRHL